MNFAASKLMMTLLIVAVVAVTVAMIGIAGGATASDEMVNTSVPIDNESTSIWVDVTGNETIDTADNTTEVTVNLINGNTTLNSTTLTVSESSTQTWQYNLTDTEVEMYDSLDLMVTGDLNYSSVEWGVPSETSGGTSSAFYEDLTDVELMILAVLALGFIIYWSDNR